MMKLMYGAEKSQKVTISTLSGIMPKFWMKSRVKVDQNGPLGDIRKILVK